MIIYIGDSRSDICPAQYADVVFVKDSLLKYCSWGDTVYYIDKPNIFKFAEGSYLYDTDGVEFLDLQMWYSTANFGYGNKRGLVLDVGGYYKNVFTLAPSK